MRPGDSHLGGQPVGWIFAAVSVLLWLLAWQLWRADAQLADTGLVATGTVVEMRAITERRNARDRNGNGKFETYHAPVIRFRARGVEDIEFVAPRGGYPDGLAVGDRLEVVYLPDSPRTAELRASTRLSFGAVLVAVLATAALVPGLVLVVWPALQRRRWRRTLDRSQRRWRRIEAEVTDVRSLRRQDDGSWRFQVRARWRDPATGRLHAFDSQAMHFDPALYLQIRHPGTSEPLTDAQVSAALAAAPLVVRLHPDDPSLYAAELLRIPGIAPEGGRKP
jgi:hypothetical protein